MTRPNVRAALDVAALPLLGTSAFVSVAAFLGGLVTLGFALFADGTQRWMLFGWGFSTMCGAVFATNQSVAGMTAKPWRALLITSLTLALIVTTYALLRMAIRAADI